jgi:hypothetical protein
MHTLCLLKLMAQQCHLLLMQCSGALCSGGGGGACVLYLTPSLFQLLCQRIALPIRLLAPQLQYNHHTPRPACTQICMLMSLTQLLTTYHCFWRLHSSQPPNKQA